MNFLTNLSQMTKGILAIISGGILLFNTLGLGGETLNTVVMIAACGLIAFGIYIANLHKKIYALLAKEKKLFTQPTQSSPQLKQTTKEEDNKEEHLE